MLFIGPFVMPVALAGTPVTSNTGLYPIAVAACAVETQHDNSPVGGGDSQITFPQFAGQRLNIKFSNGTDKEISSVTFAVSDGSNVQRVVDAGRFSPGAPIAHSFPTGLSGANHAQCTVTSVRFADGHRI